MEATLARVLDGADPPIEAVITGTSQVGYGGIASLVQDLLRSLSRYPEVVEGSALNHEPHQLAHYLRELANDFHTYYNAHQFLVEDAALRDARIKLVLATRQVLRNGLNLLGVSAPEKM